MRAGGGTRLRGPTEAFRPVRAVIAGSCVRGGRGLDWCPWQSEAPVDLGLGRRIEKRLNAGPIQRLAE